MDTAEATQVEAATITDAAALAGSSTPTQFVSNWEFDSNTKTHNVIFEHRLGSTPSSLLVLFSVDLKTVYPIQTAWNSSSSGGNPLSIWMDEKTITFSILSSYPLHSWFDGTSWTSATTGFWRVIASV